MALQSSFDPAATLKSSFYSPDELAQVQMETEQSRIQDMGLLGRGLTRGAYGIGANLNNAVGGITEPFAPQYSQQAYNDALGYQNLAQSLRAPQDISDFSQINDLGSGMNYIGGMVAENLPQLPLTVGAAGLARLGLRGVALPGMAKNFVGATAGSAPMLFGENIGEMRADPTIMANTTASERALNAAGATALQAPLDAVGDTLLMGRAGGLGKTVSNVFKDGVGKTAKDAALHVAKAVPEAALTEGVPEAGQEFVKQQMLNRLNPERDTSKDEHALINSFLGGWAAGAPMSGVGRGADVMWSQGRGAADAIRGLLSDKTLPPNLRDADNQSVLEWDSADNEQRNGWAKSVADSILNSDAADSLKTSAKTFYDKVSQGAGDAWSHLSEALGAEDKVANARSGVEHFLNSVKKANRAVDGKADAEASPYEQAMYENFSSYLNPKGATARDTELKSNLFNTIKESLLDDDWHNLPWTSLEDEFGTIGRATDAVVKMRENLVRNGQLEHDDEFGKLLDATIKDGQLGERAMMDVVKRYGKEYIGRDPKDSELRTLVRGIRSILENRSSLPTEIVNRFESQMKKQFGPNSEKVVAALSPKNTPDMAPDVSEATGISEVETPKARFIGSATKSSRKAAMGGSQENTIEAHGGFFNLGAANAAERAEVKGRFDETQADLRKDGFLVKPLSPLEYHAATGVSKSKIARSLGYKTISELETSPAKILMVEPRSEDVVGFDKDNTSLDKDDLTNLGDRTRKSLSSIPESLPVEDKELLGKLSKALAKKGGEQRKAMKALGFEHGTKLRQGADGRTYLHNNPKTDSNGVFTVHMSDGTSYDISAQHLIAQMRERGKGTLNDRSAYRMFLSGVAALQTLDGVEKITTKNIWGKEDPEPFRLAPNAPNYFQLEPGLNLGWAHKRAQAYSKAINRPDNLDAAIEEAEQIKEDLAEAQSKLDAVRKKIEDLAPGAEDEALLDEESELEAEVETLEEELAAAEENVERLADQRAQYEDLGSTGDTDPGDVRTSGEMTGLEAQDSGRAPRTHDELTGEALHPYGKLMQSGDRENVKFNGVVLRLRGGVSAKHVVGDARRVVETAKHIKEALGDRSPLSGKMDVALDLVARAAAAQKDGNRKAQKALTAMAAKNIVDALQNEIDAITTEAMALPKDQRAEMRQKYRAIMGLQIQPEVFTAADSLSSLKGDLESFAKDYAPYVPKRRSTKGDGKKFESAPDRWSHHSMFLASLELKSNDEILADGLARKARIEHYSQFSGGNVAQLLKLMREEQDLARQVLVDRKAGKAEQKLEVAPAEQVGTGAAPTQEALKAKAEIDSLRKSLDKNLKEQERAKKNKKSTKALKASEQKLRDQIKELTPKSMETEPVSVTSKPESKTGKSLDERKTENAEAGRKAYEEGLAEREAVASKAEQKIEAELSNIEKLGENLKKLVQAFRSAWTALKNSYIKGEFQKAELVKALRDAGAALSAAAGDAYRVVREQVQQIVKAYQEAGGVKPIFWNTVNKALTTARQYMDEAMKNRGMENSVPASEAGVDSQKEALIKRLSKKFSDKYATGFEVTKHSDDFAGLGSYRTYLHTIDDRLVFSVVPDAAYEHALIQQVPTWDSLSKEVQSQLLNSYIELAEQHNAIPSIHAVFHTSYSLTSNYFMVGSAFDGGPGEKYLASVGRLEKEAGVDRTWNKLSGLGAGGLMRILGENYARIQKAVGKDEVSMNWHRDTGAKAKKTGEGKGSDVKFNSEGSFANGTGVTQQEFDEAKKYVEKVLGPKVITQLVKDLGGNSAAWNRVGGDTIIRIAMQASDPLSKAHHEAMHEFFQRLLDSGSPAAEILRKAANSAAVRRQIEQFFHNDANYAKIKAALNDEHERIAYMFQLWAAGKLTVGPQTKSTFQKIVDFMRKAIGLLTNDQKAEAIMNYFHDGKMSEPSEVARILADDPRFLSDTEAKLLDAANPLMRKIREVTFTAQNILTESGNKGFEKIGRMFSTETGRTGESISFMDAKTMKTNQYNDHLFQLLRHADEKDLEAAVTGLQNGTVSKDADIAKIQGSLRKMLDHMFDYMTDAGVKIKKTKDYFPRSWDFIKIAENKAEFTKMLMDDYQKATGKPLAKALADGIVNNIVDNKGADPLNEDELEAGYTPFMAASNKRVLSFLSDPKFADYQHKDLKEIMTTYIAQAVHKAEYTRRFGQNGSKLREMIQAAVGEAVGPGWATAQKAAEQKYKAEKARLEALYPKDKGKVREELVKLGYHRGEYHIQHVVAEITDPDAKKKFEEYEPQMHQNVRAIMAMEGTLGADINPLLRKWQAGLIVYENMRLLGMSLFSQVIDPLGVLVRGGTVSDAFNTFKRGLAGVWAGWRGTPLEDSASKLAMRLGIIDAGAYLNSQGNAYSSIFLGKTAQKWNDRLFRVNGVEGFSQATRVGAMEAAIAFIKAHSKLPSDHSERWLSELNLKASDIKLDKNGDLDYSDPKIQQAIFRWVETAIMRPNASMRPNWASDPHFALIFHMKQFTYAMQKVILERVANEAKHGNYDPAISMILTYVPAMMAADFLRGLAANGGEEPYWKKKWTFGDYLADGVQRAGMFGVPQLALDAYKWGPAELAGPAPEQIAKIGKTFYKDIEKDVSLDKLARETGDPRWAQKAKDFDGIEHAAKKTLRDALPINSLSKRYVYDEIVGK